MKGEISLVQSVNQSIKPSISPSVSLLSWDNALQMQVCPQRHWTLEDTEAVNTGWYMGRWRGINCSNCTMNELKQRKDHI